MSDKKEIESSQPRQQLSTSTFRATLHQGPLPDPLTLEQYNNVVPNAAERIVTVFEEQARHRHEIEKMQMADVQERTAIERTYADSETKLAKWGLWCAFLLSILFWLVVFT